MPRLQHDMQFKCTEHILKVTGHGFDTDLEIVYFPNMLKIKVIVLPRQKETTPVVRAICTM